MSFGMYYGNVPLKLSAKKGGAPPNYLRLQKAIHLQLHLKRKTLRIVPMKPSTLHYLMRIQGQSFAGWKDG